MLPIVVRRGLTGAVLALSLTVAPAAQAQVCGNGVVEPGEECDAGAAACTYLPKATSAPVIDCRNALCTEEGARTNDVCTEQCVLTPACQPLRRDPARITFRTRPKLDMVSVTGRSVPLTTMDPTSENVWFTVTNSFGTIYSELIPGGKFIPNTKLTAWKYVLKRTGLPLLYNFRINKKLNRTTGATEFILKVKAEGDMAIANIVNPWGYTVDQLKTMTIQISVGDDVFYNTADWVVKGNGWYLADKYMFL